MNWDAINAISQMVNSIAVVLSFLYLAVQVRSSTRVAKIAVQDSAATARRDMTKPFMENEELGAHQANWLEGYERAFAGRSGAILSRGLPIPEGLRDDSFSFCLRFAGPAAVGRLAGASATLLLEAAPRASLQALPAVHAESGTPPTQHFTVGSLPEPEELRPRPPGA
jgi:hypothetical protein